MLLDRHLAEIAEAKANLATCCDLRRQVMLLDARTALAKVRRKLSLASLAVTVGLGALEFGLHHLRKRKG